MNPRICICCGEPIAENSSRLSRNPNVCASCSSLADGMADIVGLEETALMPPLVSGADSGERSGLPTEVVLNWRAPGTREPAIDPRTYNFG